MTTPTFLRSVSNIAEMDTLDMRPQIAIVGRANAGKSSLINSLANVRDLSHASATPGRTRLINLFDFSSFVLADLPGYGFSKVSKSERKVLEKLIYEYLSQEQRVKAVLVLVDANVGPTDLDQEMLAFLRDLEMPHLVVANKMDQLSRSAGNMMLERIDGQVFPSPVIPHSIVTKQGRADILLWMKKQVTQK